MLKARTWTRSGGLRHPLAYVREQHGWTHQDLVDLLAARVGNMAARREKAWRWENWDVVPDQATQAALADLLHVAPSWVQQLGWPEWLPCGTKPAVDVAWTPEGGLRLLADSLRGATVDRRGFLTLGAGVSTAVAHDWLATTSVDVSFTRGANRVGESLVAAFEIRLPALRRLEQALGGGTARPLAQQELRVVTDVLNDGTYSSKVGQRLFGVAAELGRICGWANFDSGFEAAAEHCWVAALHAAQLARDRALGANILKSMSLQAMDCGRPRDATSLAEAACGGAVGAHPLVKAMVTLRYARALAGVGEEKRVQRMLLSADDYLVAESIDPPPDWAAYFDESEYFAQTARCWMILDRHQDAIKWLERASSALPDGRSRDGATYHFWRAESYLRLGSLENAGEAIEAGLPDFRATRSDRNRARLERLGARLRGFASPVARTVNDRICEVLEA